MSKIASDVYNILRELFPYEPLISEYYVRYKGVKLFFDFYIKGLGLLFEIQGKQHFEFIKHFHGLIENFRQQKYRDNLKIEYVQENPKLTLVYFYDNKDVISRDLVIDRIHKAQIEDFNE